MRIVDDRLMLDVLTGQRVWPGDGALATTWGFHYRLVRATANVDRAGSLSAGLSDEERRLVLDPPQRLMTVLDPRAVTGLAAQLATRHGLNLLAAELVASASFNDATVFLSAPNVGRRWVDVFGAERLRLEVT